jgi:hypothetical protein
MAFAHNKGMIQVNFEVLPVVFRGGIDGKMFQAR